jgi:HKD family nuclease
MSKAKSLQLLLNDESRDHKSEIVARLQNAKRFECLVAFAKRSGWSDVQAPLEMALSKGMTARLAIGLDFYHTDPELLRSLFHLSKKHDLELYLSNSDDMFHPKIYAFEHRDGCKVVVGSANFTHGGLSQNYEASVLIDDSDGAVMATVIEHFDDLIEDEAIIQCGVVSVRQEARKPRGRIWRCIARGVGELPSDDEGRWIRIGI